MKYLSIGLFMLVAFAIGCTKNDAPSNPSSTTGLVAVPKPTAVFKITNMLPGNYIVEGKNLRFKNTSANAVSYHWDFGNGIIYDGKTPPKDIYYVPCGGNYTITLTTTNTTGETSICSQSFKVLCSGRMTHGQQLPD